MHDDVKKIIEASVDKIIKKISTPKKIADLKSKHTTKLHFIPESYRVFSGLIQSMNIQFGNLIEDLMDHLIANENDFEIITKYSGKKSNSFELSKANEARIDAYITKCQVENNESFSAKAFPKLQLEILNDRDTDLQKFKHDIDLLFKDKNTNKIFYLEIKYNDDHDTGKFTDINRKFIKTYAYLARELKITNLDDLTPILFFFNNNKMKINLYLPEDVNIKRGKKFFDEFLKNISYNDLDEYLTQLSSSSAVENKFNELYLKVVTP